ncbi:MAG: MG2 domain-containing protein, partial [Candidatus Muirbacterium halophilum]|nr:MG2 domain-containing protein [Candidatus Muirbacterium halophilum]
LSSISESKGNYAYANSPSYFSYYNPEAGQVFIFQDRAIYRPGDNVFIKVLAVKKTSSGYYVLNGNNVQIDVKDPNYKTIHTEKSKLNNMGSYSFDFKIPKGKQLGNYSIIVSTSVNNRNIQNSKNFKVEEYKKPSYEVNILKTEGIWKYNEKIKILGNVKYYSGESSQQTNLKYELRSRKYIPFFYRYFYNQQQNFETISSGNTLTDSNGEFSFIIDIPDSKDKEKSFIPYFTEYVIWVEAQDKGGRKITKEKSYKIGKEDFFFTHSFDKNFYFKNDKIILNSQAMDINENFKKINSNYSVYKLNNNELTKIFNENSNINEFKNKVAEQCNKTFLYKKSLYHNDKTLYIEIENPNAGVYLIEESSQNVKNFSIFTVIDEDNVFLPDYRKIVFQNDNYSKGDEIKFITGDFSQNYFYWTEIFKNNFFVENRFIKENKNQYVQKFVLPDDYRGNIKVNIFGNKNKKQIKEESSINIIDKDILFDIYTESIPDKMEPGEEKIVNVNISNSDICEILALMYDESLDYYSKNSLPDFLSLQRFIRSNQRSYNSLFNPYVSSIFVDTGIMKSILLAMRKKEINYSIPQIKTWRTRYSYHSFMPTLGASMELSMSKSASIQSDSFEMSENEPKEGSSENTDNIRSEFNDTALFLPHIISKNGNFNFNIKLPDQLTRWKLHLFANTKDMRIANSQKSIIAQKKLSIRADIPRFLRENDTAQIQAMVANNTENSLNTNLNIKILNKNIDITKDILLSSSNQNDIIKSNETKFFNFTLKPNNIIDNMQIIFNVKSNQLSDTEIVYLPVLPAYERLLISDIKLIDGNSKTILKNTPSSQKFSIEKSVLSIEPNTVINLLSAMPYIINHSVYSTNSFAYRFVPLAIINNIFQKNPEIARLSSTIEERHSILLPWEQKDPRQMLSFDETPWKTRSEGYKLDNLISLTDSKKVAENTEYFIEKLVNSQNSDGGFPWIPGGKSNLYTTMNILENLSQVISYNIKLPEKTIEKALNFILNEFNKKDKLNKDDILYQCYAGFVISEYYGAEYKGASRFITYLKKWSEDIEKRKHALSPLGKTMFSIMLTNIGRKAMGKEIIDAVMDNSEKSEQGIFWTPEKYSWIWYNDTINNHCMVIRALNKINPNDNRIKDLVTWLLWNRKGNSWDTPDHSVKAIYAILESMKLNSNLLSEDKLFINWAEEKEEFIIDPFSKVSKILISKEKNSVKNSLNLLNASIEKQGKGSLFASLTTMYIPQGKTYESSNNLVNISRKYFIKKKNNNGKEVLYQIKENDIVNISTDIEVELTIETSSQLEFVYIKDPKPTGFENKDLLSSWQYNPLWFYREIRDSSTRFFFDWLPHGSLKIKYTLYATKKGNLLAPPATIQSVYSPDINAHTDSYNFHIEN